MLTGMEKYNMPGRELKQLRRDALRLRQDKFAEMLDVHVSTVSDWERTSEKLVPRCVAMLARILADEPAVRERVIEEVFPAKSAEEALTP